MFCCWGEQTARFSFDKQFKILDALLIQLHEIEEIIDALLAKSRMIHAVRLLEAEQICGDRQIKATIAATGETNS
jgi:hypothetical protein